MRSVSLEMKLLLALAPIALIAMGYALTQSNWKATGVLVFCELLILMSYRREKRTNDNP